MEDTDKPKRGRKSKTEVVAEPIETASAPTELVVDEQPVVEVQPEPTVFRVVDSRVWHLRTGLLKVRAGQIVRDKWLIATLTHLNCNMVPVE